MYFVFTASTQETINWYLHEDFAGN